MKKIILKTSVFIGFFLAITVSIQSCKDPAVPPAPTNESEVITSVKIEMTDTLTGQKLNYFFRDLDGEGGNAPSQWDTIRMTDSSFYKVTLRFLNESDPNNIKDISAEIYTEKANHIICFTPDLVNTEIKRTDSDGTYELGLLSTWETGTISTGNITITLKHQPGLKNGNCEPGETDAEVKFQAKVY